MPDAVPLSSIQDKLNAAAQQYGIDPNILLHQARQESGLNPAARSRAGAMGVMQLMPATARGLGVDPTNTDQNIQGGAHYMRQMLDRYGGDYNLALAAYNAGPGRVDAYLKGGALPTETQNYVPAILGRGRGGAGGAPNVPLASLAPTQPGVGSSPDAGTAPALSMEDVAGILGQVRAAQQAFNAPIGTQLAGDVVPFPNDPFREQRINQHLNGFSQRGLQWNPETGQYEDINAKIIPLGPPRTG